MSITKMRNSMARYLKFGMYLFALIFFISCFTGYNSYVQNRGQNQSQKATVATVNGRPISREEFAKVLQMQYDRSRERGGVSALMDAGLKSQILRQFVDERLRVAEAEKRGISVGWRETRRGREKMIDDHIEQIRQAASGARGRKLSDKELNILLSHQSPPQTIDSLRKDLSNSLTDDVVRQQLMVQKMDDQLKNVGNIDDKRLADSFRQIQVRQIVISTAALPEAQARRKADEVLKRIKSGEDFAKLAAQFSDDAATKKKGGEMGYTSPMYDKDLQGLKVGETSGVLKTYQGYGIVQVENSKLDLPKDFEKNKKQYRDQLKTMLQNQAKNEAYQAMQKTAKVEVIDPELRGYWLADQARVAASPAERDKLISAAIGSLQKVTDSAAARTVLAQLYQMQGNHAKALQIMSDMLDKDKLTEGADLRLILAQLYIQAGQKDKAKPQLDIASEMAYNDPNIHYQLQSMYKMIGDSAAAAKEDQWTKDYDKKMQAQAAASAPTPAPAPKKK